MIIVMELGATEKNTEEVIRRIEALGFLAHPIYGVERTVIGAIGDERGKHELQQLEGLQGVEKVVPILKPFKLASRELRVESSEIDIEGVSLGGKEFNVIAGPCSVETLESLSETAEAIKDCGARMLRGGAFKPRTSPYSFQGHREDGLKMLREVKEKTGLPIVTELMDPRNCELVCEYADVLQIGARNMQNFQLLTEVGKAKKPVLLKRGIAATINEWLQAAEYILSEGNPNVILCERGIRTYETETRNTLDIAAVPVVKRYSHLPVIIDPSHAAGDWHYVESLSLAAVAAGADGLIVEVHHDPPNAWSDGAQSLRPDKFKKLMTKLKPVLEAVGKTAGW
ncbi:MAG: 3-deoxy-7-phosphoheptulonate synthase [Candidatus Omnitrophica bacterium]|nr:3-deoxy-7-phosphoheptulonate synthase [Candidatus Omnitrophota bacterium]MCA9424123.1 3-deoxy-7-phosphoheptulonate synthase [Candidatus Omnitrophota bacterium]MCA9447459.1 3-deoxy-7-phosphoheptulonate synthase [Candidatus Omnitrophota bacterium]